MGIIGNIFLGIAGLIYFLLASSYTKPTPRSGDAAMSHAMGLFLFAIVFSVCMMVVTFAIAWKGNFDWVSESRSQRNKIVIFGLLAMLATTAFCTILRSEPASQMPFSIRYLAGHGAWWMPLLLLAAGFVLLNDSIKASLPVGVYKIPLQLFAGLSLLVCAGLLIEWFGSMQKDEHRRIATMQADEARYHQQHLDDIEKADAMNGGILGILVFTGKYHEEDVRQNAILKIKSNPNWQQVLVELLDGYYAGEVFTFLEACDVDDKTLFAEPVRKGVLHMAAKFRDSMERTHTLHSDEFDYDTRRILATVDKFQGLGVDYAPAIQALRAVLDLPRTQKVKINAIPTLDEWLKKRGEK